MQNIGLVGNCDLCSKKHALTLSQLYQLQIDFQKEVLNKLNKKEINTSTCLPQDDVHWFSYHIQAMVEELGEALKADKRWKTHRNETFLYEEKVDEVVDIIITALNLAIFSGINHEQLENELLNKIKENIIRINVEDNNG